MRTADELADWQGYLSRNEVAEIKRITALVPGFKEIDVVVVNIGAGAGTSTFSFLETRDDLIVYSVDILATGSEVTTNEHLRLAESGHDTDGRVIRVWGDSKLVGKRWPYPIDILFIDGDHDPGGCMADMKTWVDKVVPEFGYVLIHDYGKKDWPAVKAEVDQFMFDNPKFEYVSTIDTLISFRVKE